jgi:regulator of protease activity HflC (stomatin/prohibitin superfamily)
VVGVLILEVVLAALAVGVAWIGASARIVKQYERGLVFRLGRVLDETRGPGLLAEVRQDLAGRYEVVVTEPWWGEPPSE